MFRNLLRLCLIMMPVVCMAEKAYVLGDTVYLNDHHKEVPIEDATLYAIVKNIDTENNLADIHYFSFTNYKLVAIEHRVASGEDYGKKKGEQIHFDENGTMTSKQQYTLVRDDRKGKTRSRLAQEQLFYPDGKLEEDLQFTYDMTEKGESRSYDRKCYYPDGTTLKYREIVAGDGEQHLAYFDEGGVETYTPTEEVPLYETMPAYPGGVTALTEYLHSIIQYPPEAQKKHIEGKVIVEFVVDRDGSVMKVRVLHSSGDPSLDKEAVRVVSKMPKWIPGTLRGKVVRVKYTIPVNFRLE